MLMKSSDSIDLSFSLSLTQRLRFTADITDDDGHVLIDLLEPSGTAPAKVQVWIDAFVASADPSLVDRLSKILRAEHASIALTCQAQTIPGGEACKNDPSIVEHLLHQFNAHDLDRRSYVIAIGGGAVLDTVGYAASIAHRGIRLIRIPTTTLAQADSGVGVKNAVNWFGKKNWKGTFHVPWAVINDRKVLQTLPDRDFRCGFSEVVKVSLLKQPAIFDRICDKADKIFNRHPETCDAAIRDSVQLHLEHITGGGDPFEMLEARPLDFGHWSAHRLESLTNYELRHGEAVAIGLVIDCIYSQHVLGLPERDCNRIIDCLRRLGLPLNHPALGQPDALLDGLEEFRQHLGGRLTVTMIDAIGNPVDIHDIDHRQMKRAIAASLDLA